MLGGCNWIDDPQAYFLAKTPAMVLIVFINQNTDQATIAMPARGIAVWFSMESNQTPSGVIRM